MSKPNNKLLEELFSLWKEYTKRKNIFLSIKESKIKKDFSLHLDQIKEILQEFNIDLKTLFRIFFHYHKDEIDHINFLRNYKKTLFYHYRKAYKKFKNILSLINEKFSFKNITELNWKKGKEIWNKWAETKFKKGRYKG